MQLHQKREVLDRRSVETVLISFNPARQARTWVEQTGIKFQVLLDPDRLVYKAYETERSLFRSWNPRTVIETIQLLRAGRRWRGIQGDSAQLGGDFVIDPDGFVRLSHYSLDPVDYPVLDDILQVIDLI